MRPETARWLLTGAHAFQKDPKLDSWNGISRQNFTFLLNAVFRTDAFDEAVRFLEQVVAEEISAPSIPPDLNVLLADWERAQSENEEIRKNAQQKVAQFLVEQQKLIQKNQPIIPLAGTNEVYAAPEQKSPQAQEVPLEDKITLAIEEALGAQLKTLKPEILPTMSQKISRPLTEKLKQFPTELTPQGYEEFLNNLWPDIEQELQKQNLSLDKEQTHNLILSLVTATQEDASSLITSISSSRPGRPLPSSSQEEGAAFVPLYTLLQPQVAMSFTKKIILSPVVKTLQATDKVAGQNLTGNYTREWRGLLHYGLGSADIAASIAFFRQAKVSTEDPRLKKLEAQEVRIDAYEKSHRLVSSIINNYHEFSKITGRRQIFSEETQTFLPELAQKPIWRKKGSYSWKLREVLNQTGLALKIHKKVQLAPEKKVIKFALLDQTTKFLTLNKIREFKSFRSFFYQKTLGLAMRGFNKTAMAKGIGKGASWLLSRMGLASLPTGVTQAATLVLLAKDFLKLALKVAKKGLKIFFRFLEDHPFETAALGGAIMAIGFFLVTAPLQILFLGAGGFLSAFGLLAGAGQIAGGLMGGISGLLGGTASAITGIISSLTSISIPPIMTTVGVVGGVASTGLLTLLTIGNTTSAFIPKSPGGGNLPTPSGEIPVVSLFMDVKKTVAPKNNFENRELPVTINYTITVSPAIKDKKLLNVKISDKLEVNKEGGSPTLPPPRTWSIPEIKDTWTQSYPVIFSKEFTDSAITNTITVTADIDGGPKGEQAAISAMVQIGSAPLNCFAFVGPWSTGEINVETQAINHLLSSPSYRNKLCAFGQISLVRKPWDSGYGGDVPYGALIINLYNLGVGSFQTAVYTLAHESGHVVGNHYGDIFGSFLKMFPSQENYLCSYTYGHSQNEDFAENIAVYSTLKPVSWLTCGNMKSAYPKSLHHQFASQHLFSGFEY